MNDEEKKEVKALEKSAKLLGDISGRVVAPLVGLIAAGPVGAIFGGVVGTMIKYGVEDFCMKTLASKEIRRVGTSADYIIRTLNSRLENGEEARGELFENKDNGISDAEEIFEGVLSKVKNEYQEKKLIYLSNIFINATFDKTISADNINQIINVVDRLSYRQLCLISLVGKNSDNKYGLRVEENRKVKLSEELFFILDEVRDMKSLGIMRSKDRMGLNNYMDPSPAQFCLDPLGYRIFQLTGLENMPDEEYTFIGELQ